MTSLTAAAAPPKAAALRHPDPGAIRRAELSAFLRSRRERISPSQAGVPLGGRRRTPGLRREEVAQLAGLGVTWYTWLEQGRDIKVSDQVLESIAQTLLLDPDERAHLFTLAGSTEQAPRGDCSPVTPAVLSLLDQLMPFPACVQTGKYDLLAYNTAYARLIDDLDALPVEDRNCMWLLFTNPSWRKACPDWDIVAARMVAQFRALMAEHVAEPAWKAHLRRLRRASPEFAALWDRHEVAGVQNKGKRFRNPLVGMLRFDVTNTWLQPRHGMRLLMYTPAENETRRRLDRLVQIVEEERCA